MTWLSRRRDPADSQAELARLQAASDQRQRDLDQFLQDVSDEIDKLVAVREWLATYPEIPVDVTGDPEAMIVVKLRKMLA